MTKATKREAEVLRPNEAQTIARRQLHSIQRWKCHHAFDCSEIELYSEISGKWEFNIMVTGVNHIALAEFIVHAANERNQSPNLLNDAVAALKLCLDDLKLSLKPAQAAANVVLRTEPYTGGNNAS